MNRTKFTLIMAAMFLLSGAAKASTVDVYDGKYEGLSQVSFVMGQGDVETQIFTFLGRLYPNAQVILKSSVKGFLLAEVEISGSSVENVATDMLAGLGLSACYYANNVIEVGTYKKRGVCPRAMLPNGDKPKVKQYGDGIFSVTNEWHGQYIGQGMLASNGSAAGVVKASYVSHEEGSPRNVKFQISDVESSLADDGSADMLQPLSGTPEQPLEVSFKMTQGMLAPQIKELLRKIDNAPQVVWELDENIHWFNDSEIRRGTYIEIFADILASYNAFADVYENNVIVVRNGDFQ